MARSTSGPCRTTSSNPSPRSDRAAASMTAETRVAGATIVATPERVLVDAEIAFSTATGLITYLGPVRGSIGPGDLDAANRIVAPGLITSHPHAAMSLLRGHSDDEPLQQWLGHIRAFELRM